MSISKTIIINCAGRGTRLGLNKNKSLIDISGKPLIIRQLENLDEFNDIRIVVGFQADEVIKTVLSYRKDITFVFNHNYLNTKTAGSLSLGKRFSENSMVVSIDGDILFKPGEIQNFINCDDKESIGICNSYSNKPVYVKTINKNNENIAIGFSETEGDYEWTGIFKILSKNLSEGNDHVYKMITNNLPIATRIINLREIDYQSDYEEAIRWKNDGYK